MGNYWLDRIELEKAAAVVQEFMRSEGGNLEITVDPDLRVRSVAIMDDGFRFTNVGKVPPALLFSMAQEARLLLQGKNFIK
jgi:hypothetical protein